MEDKFPYASRHSIRLPRYDYSSAGAYFVTLCTKERINFFGEIKDGAMRLSDVGEIIAECWRSIPSRMPHITIDLFVVMPNHLHGVIWIKGEDPEAKENQACGNQPMPRRTEPNSLGAAICAFKSIITKRLRDRQDIPVTLWQRNFHEQIIRSDEALNRIREYIHLNPTRWADDPERL